MSQQRGAARMWWTYSRDETVQALMELEPMGERLGGGFVVTPIRQRVIEDGVPANDPSGKPLFATVAWCFKHESFMPAVDPSRVPQPPPLPAEEGELTPEEMHAHFPVEEPEPEVVEAAAQTAAEQPDDEPDLEVLRARLEAEGPAYEPVNANEGLTAEEIKAEREARAARAADPTGSDQAGDAVVAAGARAQR